MGGFDLALSPPHLATDGDTLFALSVGAEPRSAGAERLDLGALGRRAATLVAEAIVRAVRSARSLPGLPAAGDV
jgi:L-aminopeptidase/D-esterase-like protein